MDWENHKTLSSYVKVKSRQRHVSGESENEIHWHCSSAVVTIRILKPAEHYSEPVRSCRGKDLNTLHSAGFELKQFEDKTDYLLNLKRYACPVRQQRQVFQLKVNTPLKAFNKKNKSMLRLLNLKLSRNAISGDTGCHPKMTNFFWSFRHAIKNSSNEGIRK